MLVTRRPYDAAAAGCVGVGVVLITFQVKPVPDVISYLGPLAYAWGLCMFLGSIFAMVGSLLRTRDPSSIKRRAWFIRLETFGWPLIGGCALVFCIGVWYQFGLVNAMLTVGWAGFTISTCIGHWRDLRPPRSPRDKRHP